MVVTGSVDLKAVVPDKVWTRLARNAKKGDTSITVLEATPKTFESNDYGW